MAIYIDLVKMFFFDHWGLSSFRVIVTFTAKSGFREGETVNLERVKTILSDPALNRKTNPN